MPNQTVITAFLLRLLAGAFVALGWSGPLHAQDGGLYTAAKVSVDVTADDAVSAKNQALTQAKQYALRTVFKRLTPYSAYGRLPTVKTAAIDEMLTNFSIRREANSATRYLATLDFQFNPAAVRRLLSNANVSFTDVQSAPVTVLPILIQDGKVVTTGRDPWRRAWLALDLRHAVSPVRLVQHGTSLTGEAVSAMLAGAAEGFEELRQKHRTEQLVLAVADVSAQTSGFGLRLYGLDSAGAFALARTVRVHQSDMAAAARRGAQLSLGILEGRWKLIQSIPDGEGADVGRHSVTLTVEFSSLRQWQRIKSRLAKIPGVQSLKVAGLSARSAEVTFRYPGGAPSLASKLGAHNMQMANLGGRWVLSGNEP